MKNLIFICQFILFCSCANKMVEGRFDHKVIFPSLNAPKIVETDIDLKFGPGPQDEVNDEPSKEEVPEKVPEEIQPSTSWWN